MGMAVLVTYPQLLTNTCSKTAHAMMLSWGWLSLWHTPNYSQYLLQDCPLHDVRGMAVLVTHTRWLTNTCPKTAHFMMLSGEGGGGRCPCDKDPMTGQYLLQDWPLHDVVRWETWPLSEGQALWWPWGSAEDNLLVGLVVKASASRAEDPGFESRLRRDFFGVESYQWLKNWHSSGTLPGAWRYRVSTGTDWPVSVYCDWVRWTFLVCNFYLSVAARKIVWADPSQRYTCMLLGR